MGKKKSTFLQATTDDNLNVCYHKGLRGLGTHSAKIQLGEPRHCNGSINIDDCLSTKYPNDNRWDYCFAYREKVYFVEIHPASTSDVDTVIRKLNWLKNWLASEAPEIYKLRSPDPYFWIQTKSVTILPNSKQARKIALAGIKPISALRLA